MPSFNDHNPSESISNWKPAAFEKGLSHDPPEKQPLSESFNLPNYDSFVLLETSDWPSASLGVTVNTLPIKPNRDLENEKHIDTWDPPDIEMIGVGYPLDEVISGFHLPQTGRMGEVRMNASQIISSAEKHAQELIANAETKAQELIRAAETQAEQHYHQGHAEGLDVAKTETEALLQAMQAIVEEVQAWKISMLDQGEMMMLRLVIEIAQTIFGDGLPLDPDSLGQTFSRVLAEAKPLGDLRVYVHPDDAAAISPHWSKMQTAFGGKNIELVPSEIIKRGGCFIDGQFGSVDARVETQLEIAKETLLSTLKRKNGSNS